MPRNQPRLERQARLAGGRGAIAGAIGLAHDFAAAAALSEDDAVRLALIVEELVANIVEHGGVGPAEHIEVRIEPDRDGSAVRVALSDPCPPFDPRGATHAEAPPERGGGAGLAMVRAWATILAWRHADGRNVLELRMPIRAHP